MAEQKEVKKEVQKYTLGEVITGTAPTIIVDGKPLSDQEALVLILNKLDKIEDNVSN